MTTNDAPAANLVGILAQGLTVTHLAVALNTNDETIRAILRDPGTPLDPSTCTTLTALTAGEVAAANNLISAHDLDTHLTRLMVDGCTLDDIARTIGTTTHRLTNHGAAWLDPTTGPACAWNLTIDQVNDPHVPAALTWGRLESLETMGWSRDDVEATIGPGLPTSPKGVITRGVAQAVVAYWQAFSGRLNPTTSDLARARRAQGVRTPADWEPPTTALWWPSASVRASLGADTDWTCGPSPRRH